MMSSSVARMSIVSLSARAVLPRAVVASSRMFSIESDMRMKESAEENKFVRERETALLDLKHAKEKAELANKFAAEERKGHMDAEAEFDAKLTESVSELKALLGPSDSLGAESMLSIAKWKLAEE